MSPCVAPDCWRNGKPRDPMIEAIGFLSEDDRLHRALEDLLGRVPAQARRRFVLEGATRRRRSQRALSRLLIVSWAKDLSTTHLPDHLEGASTRWEGHLVFVGPDTPAEALSSAARLRVQDPSRLQFVTAADLKQARRHLRAFIQRLIHASGSEGIFHAWWSGASLELLTTEFRRLSVPRSSIAPLKKTSTAECQNLEVAYDGSYIAWPSVDVHLGFEQIEAMASPERALRIRQRSAEFNQGYGAAIRTVRQDYELTQSSIPGLSPRQVGRIERGETRATSKALRSLAQAHELPDDDYLKLVAAALVRPEREP